MRANGDVQSALCIGIKKDVIGQKNGKTEITGSQEQADSKGSACQTYVASEVSKASEGIAVTG